MVVLDSNVLINAKNFYYRMGIFPVFWKWLSKQFNDGNVISLDHVYQELIAGKDKLKDWAKENKDHFVDSSAREVQAEYANVLRHVMTLSFSQEKVDEFFSKADPWIIAYSKVNDATLITHESFNTQRQKKKIYIPNICDDFDVEYINTFDMMEKLGVQFS